MIELIIYNNASYISITGAAGTGKTLLIYDLVSSLQNINPVIISLQNINPVIIHCGNLNDGQTTLVQQEKWHIVPIKKCNDLDLNNHKVVFIDEAQRMMTKQLKDIIQKTNLSNTTCIFSYDKSQTLSKKEIQGKIHEEIEKLQPSSHSLSEKIRTNKEIAQFIKMLFNKHKNPGNIITNNIVLNYFSDEKDAYRYTQSLDQNEWKILKLTPSQYTKDSHASDIMHGETSHSVIGQEFDAVLITIDQHFKYAESGKLYYKGTSYYDATKMLFQNITRVRKRLNVVIINNEVLLSRCLYILNG